MKRKSLPNWLVIAGAAVIGILILAAIAFLFYNVYIDLPEYGGENPELYTVAIHNFLGSAGYGSNGEIPISSQTEVIGTDSYGRVLFCYHEGVIMEGCGYGILQKMQDGYARLAQFKDLESGAGVELLQSTYLNRLNEHCGLRSDPAMVDFLRHRALNGMLQANHYRAFTDHTALYFMYHAMRRDKRFEAAVKEEGLGDADITVALMGCAVNGPGEAREADIGIAGGVGEAILFSHGEIIEKVREDEIIEKLIKEIKKITKN